MREDMIASLLEPLDLTGHVITADALHTRRGHAEFLFTARTAHYVFIVKKKPTRSDPQSPIEPAVTSA